VAVQVRLVADLILPPAAQSPGSGASTKLKVTGPQASLAVGVGKTGVAGHSMVVSGAQAMLGAVVSATEMVWLQLAVLPHSSVAVQVRLVADLILPPAAQSPGSGASTKLKVTGPQASLAIGVGKTGVAGHSMVVSGAQAMLGAVVSATEMVWLQLAVLPHSSVAVQVRLVADLSLPPVEQLPGSGASTKLKVTGPQASLAVGVGNTGVAGHSMVVSGGQAMLAAVVSATE